MKYVVYFAIGWCVMLAVAGEAMAYTGSDLLESCSLYMNDQIGLDFSFCMGFVAGVEAAVHEWQTVTGQQTYCIPEGALLDQLIRVVVKHLENNPEQLHRRASVTVQAAFVDAFPCPEGK